MRNRKLSKLVIPALVLAISSFGAGSAAWAAADADPEFSTEAVNEEAETVEAVYGGEETTEEVYEEPGTESDADSELLRIRFAKDRQELYDVLSSLENYYLVDYDSDDVALYEAEKSETIDFGASMKDDSVSSVAAVGTDFSDVNVRHEGVDEADVIRTDGKYIYIFRNDMTVSIVEPGSSGLKEAAVIELPEDKGNLMRQELFIGENLLQVICSRDYYDRDTVNANPYIQETLLYTYDLSDLSSPVLTGTFRQDGYYKEARKKDGKIYLFTSWTPYIGSDCENSDLTPDVCGSQLEPGAVCIPDTVSGTEYYVIASVDEKDPSVCLDAKALVSGSGLTYVSTDSIYAMYVDWSSYRTATEIIRFSYKDGSIEGVAAGRVRGSVKDSFCIDEYNGCLRVLTTYRGRAGVSVMEVLSDLFGFYYSDPEEFVDHNALFVLDDQMRLVGRIRDFASGETIRSARYFGDTAYFVTFRNTDPLFTADLSDPASPRIIGELEIPGFSGYLHPFGQGRLLGVGYSADPQTGWTTGIKLSLYDISDPVNVTESDLTTIDGITYLPALDDYRAFLVNAERGLIGFYLDDRYMVYTLTEEGGFERSLLYDFFEDNLQDNYGYDEIRGLFIGSEFYLAGPAFTAAFDMNDGYVKTDVLKLTEVKK